MKPGDVFWFEDSNGVKHLHVVLTHPEPHPERADLRMRVAVVNVTTVQTKRYDNTVELRNGDHKRITRLSYVLYQEANFEFADELESKGKQVESLKDDLFWKVFNGIWQGKRLTPSVVKEYCGARVHATNHKIVKNLYAESEKAAVPSDVSKPAKN